MKYLALLVSLILSSASAQGTLLNVSYDPTHEFYVAFNRAFNAYWVAQGHEPVEVQASHGGSGSQARAVIDGLGADVVTLALAGDVDEIASQGLIAEDWQTRLPDNSSPYTSTVVFLVRTGNPEGIQDWGDLTKEGVEVITPNPKTSGGARWNFLAAWQYGLEQGGDEAAAQAFVTELYQHVPVLDSGARGATTTFVERGLGDVLLAWENEAFLAVNELGQGEFEIIVPPKSILAEPPVAVVDENVDDHGTREVAEAYLEYLYSEEGQDLAAQNYYRPRLASVAAKYKDRFPELELFTITDAFGGWAEAQPKFFDDGGVFDQIYLPQ